jgi:transcriptional regulator with XRE-family HTH domain
LVDEKQFFRAFGGRVKKLRRSNGFTQEDMIGFGFSARHWQQIEAGRPITVRTMLRICDIFAIRAAQLVEGLDRGIYRK